MFEISAVAASHINRAILVEIDRLERIHQESGDDWPKDFDPNDIYMLRGMVPYFPDAAEGKITVLSPTSKPVRFTIALIPGYISENKALLSAAEVKALETVLADYEKVQAVMPEDDAPLWLQHLKALGHSQGFLTYAQVNESLPLAIVDPEEIESIVEQLKRSGIRVVPVGN